MSSDYPNNNATPTPSPKKKSNLLIMSLAVLIIVAMGTCAFIIHKSFFTEKDKPLTATRKTSENESPKPFVGSVIVFEADAENPTDEQMDNVVQMMVTRLDGLGFTDATVTRQGEKKVIIEIPSEKDPVAAAETLGATAQLQFMDNSGNVLLTVNIKTASAKCDQITEAGGDTHYLELVFTESGSQKLASATAQNIGQPIHIMMDDIVLSSPIVNEQINSDTCIIAGDFTAETAQAFAAQIRSGQLPFNLNQIESRRVIR